MRHMRHLYVFLLAAISACFAPESGQITLSMLFSVGDESGIGAARDITIDDSGSVFIFDYDDYSIHKFNRIGGQVAEFGGMGEDAGTFSHLMAIKADDDSLLALDAGSMSAFDRAAYQKSRTNFLDTVTVDFPRIGPAGQWLGEWIIVETAEKCLTYRNALGLEVQRLACYDLADHFPGIEPGVDFFINPTQAPFYLYEFDQDGNLFWMRSDRFQLFRSAESDGMLFYEASADAVPFEEDAREALRERSAAMGPPFFINVPDSYKLVHHLLVSENGDIWLYLKSAQRTGMLRISSEGRELGFYEVLADFDVISSRATIVGGKFYFMTTTRGETRVYEADLP